MGAAYGGGCPHELKNENPELAQDGPEGLEKLAQGPQVLEGPQRRLNTGKGRALAGTRRRA